MTTDLAKIGQVNNDRQKGMQAMLYHYDQLHRIVKSQSLTTYGEGTGFASRTASPAAYDEKYTYDANGNIITLDRRAANGSLADDFDYTYYTNTNKLRKVKSADADYVYDAIGNLITDNVQGVHITWTPYGKVREVKSENNTVTISFRYDAAGNRVVKHTVKPDTTYVTHYVRDGSGKVMAVYADEEPIEWPVYESSRLGQYMGGVKEGHQTLGRRRYELNNHLGNVLTVVTDNVGMNGDSVWARVVRASDYYPFGLEMASRTWNNTTTAYRYGFNGKEKDQDEEFGSMHYDYGFRIYNPRVAKFLSVDPVTNSYPQLTPYQFASNTPIRMIDLDGLEAMDPMGMTIHYHFVGENFKAAGADKFEAIKTQGKRDLVASASGAMVGAAIMMSPVAGRWLLGNWHHLLYNPIIHNEIGATIYGTFADDEWPSPLPAQMDNHARAARSAIKWADDVPFPSKLPSLAERTAQVYKAGDKFEIDNTFIDGVDNLAGTVDLGWYGGETAYFSISAILKHRDNKVPGSVFKSLTMKAERIAREAGLKEVRIEFQMVLNPRLQFDESWAKEFGYYFSKDKDKNGVISVTWEKPIE